MITKDEFYRFVDSFNGEYDELDLFAAFCQGKLEDIVSQSYMPVFGLSKMFDDEYNSEMLGLNSLLNNLET